MCLTGNIAEQCEQARTSSGSTRDIVKFLCMPTPEPSGLQVFLFSTLSLASVFIIIVCGTAME